MKIVSGGQTGVDRAALDVAVALAIPYAGWVPRGGSAEDMTEPPGLLAAYPHLAETPTEDPRQRTVWNVRDSDATLVLTGSDVISPGTALTVMTAQRLGRPQLVVLLDHTTDHTGEAVAWLRLLGPDVTLNVAGPRESQWPGAQVAAESTLHRLLGSDD